MDINKAWSTVWPQKIVTEVCQVNVLLNYLEQFACFVVVLAYAVVYPWSCGLHVNSYSAECL